ncbi:MAG: hypothetical protein B6V02_03205 [Thermoprotei archaeon ex4572_64]|nr:MAG: hypothetical protein B6V02_03205 [Thermoprotei archaeon ex4572_64]
MQIKIGCCGFCTARSTYFKEFNVVELQETFYDMPSEDRMRSLRSEAYQEFEFTVKVFQAITHSSNSPTWKKMKYKLQGELKNYGYLKPTRENLNIWDEFLGRTKPLNARVYIFQTPPSMPVNEDSCKWVIDFFRTIESKDLIFCWEPRGEWYRREDLLRKVLDSTSIVHVVDPLKRKPLKISNVMYFRLHGLNHGEVNYRYKYTDNDLEKLSKYVKSELNSVLLVYILFNNIYMRDDALRFKKFIES